MPTRRSKAPTPPAPKRAAAAAPEHSLITVRIPSAMLEECRAAVAYLKQHEPEHAPPLNGLFVAGLARELARLRRAHHEGKPFPRSRRKLRPGRPAGS